MHRRLIFLAGLVALSGLAILLLPSKFDSALFWSSFKQAHLWWVLGSVAVTFVAYAIRALRWQVLLFPMKRIPFVSLLNGTTLGFGAIYAVGRPGEVVRPLWVARRHGVTALGAVASIIVERVFDMLMLLLLFVVGSMSIELPAATRQALGGLGAPWQLMTLVAIALTGFVLLHVYAKSIARWLPFDRLKTLMETFAQGLAGTSTPRGFVRVTLYSLLLWSVHALQFWLMLEAIDLSYPVAGSILTLALTSLGSVAQVPGIGGGFQAGFIVSATTVLGTPAEVAVAASLMVWFMNTVPTLVVSGIYMMWKGISVKDLKIQERELRQPVG